MSWSKAISLWCVCGVAAVLAACATTSSEPVKQRIDDALSGAQSGDASSGAPLVPPDVRAALLPPLSQPSGAETYAAVERRFDVIANNAPARDVFVGLTEGTPYSMVVHPDVQGTISLDLKNVTVVEALEVLRNVHGYDYQRDGSRIMILGQGLRTKMFPVNYLTLSRRGTSQTSMSSGGLTAEGATGGISVATSTESNFWEELKTTLEALIGSEGGRKVVVNPQANLVIVRALPRELDLVNDYLGLAHETIGRQVLLEAKIVEVELKEGFQAGINWASLDDSGDITGLAAQTGGGTLGAGGGVSDIGGNTGLLDPGSYNPISNSETSAFGGIFSVALRKGADFAAFFELLKTQGDVHVLSSPRVATVNNQKAVIKVGGDEFFVTGVTGSTDSTSGGTTTSSTPDVQLEAFFSGIALDVTPQIDQHEVLTLHIHPTVSEVTQSNKSFVIGSENFSLPLAASNVQESDNIVRARTGQVIVIGGLMKEATTENEASVPLLGDLPMVGNLFKQRRVSRIKKELVILLKPTVMATDERWQRDMQDTRNRVIGFTRER